MIDYTHTPLKESVAKLLDLITAHTNTTSNPDIEKLARVVTLQLKTIYALFAHEIREREEIEQRARGCLRDYHCGLDSARAR